MRRSGRGQAHPLRGKHEVLEMRLLYQGRSGMFLSSAGAM